MVKSRGVVVIVTETESAAALYIWAPGRPRKSAPGQEAPVANGLLKFEGDLLVLYLRGRQGVDGRGLLPGGVEVAAGGGQPIWGSAGAPPRDQGGSDGVRVLGDIFQWGGSLRKRQGDMLDNLDLLRACGDRDGGRK